MPPALPSRPAPAAQDEELSRCEEAVLSCFPDICPDFLKTQAADHDWDPQRLTTHLLDEQEKGKSYPKRPGLLKRKRPERDEGKEEKEDDLRNQFEEGDPRLASKDRAYVNAYTRTASVPSSLPTLVCISAVSQWFITPTAPDSDILIARLFSRSNFPSDTLRIFTTS